MYGLNPHSLCISGSRPPSVRQWRRAGGRFEKGVLNERLTRTLKGRPPGKVLEIRIERAEVKLRQAVYVLSAGIAVSVAMIPGMAAYADQPPTATTASQTTSVYTGGNAGWTATGGASSSVISECPNAAWTATVPNANAQWMWVDDQGGSCAGGNTPGTAPAETVTFTNSFSIPSGNLQAAVLNIATDNGAEVFVNGHDAGPVSGFGAATQIDITNYLVAGATNTIAIQAYNQDNGCQPGSFCNPAGVLASVDVVSNLTSTDFCKNGGWMQWTNPSFNNQGDCVSYVVSHSPKSS